MQNALENRKMEKKRHSTAGFTLIELLVVIAIIALLVSILLPSLRKASNLARDVVCSTNLRIISLGVITYASDNNDNIMNPYYRNWDLTRDDCNWKSDLYREGYVSDKKAFICPRNDMSANVQISADNAPHMGFYGINALWGNNAPDWQYVTLDEISVASDKILVAENNGDWAVFYVLDDAALMSGPTWQWSYLTDTLRHEGFANIGFADGHAGKLNADEINPSDDFWRHFKK